MQLFWLKVINNELESIMSNHTWKLVELPPKTKPIGCKWMFKKKVKANDIIDKYKTHLVGKGDMLIILIPILRLLEFIC